MSVFARAVFVFGLAALLAGCGGGAASFAPAGSVAPRAPLSVIAANSGTLYVAATSSVYAVPLNSNGPTNAVRTITPHPNQTNHLITGVATSADGTLDILERYFDGPSQSVQHCRVVVEGTTANGSPAASNIPCDATDQTQSESIARNYSGGFDVLITDVTSGKDLVRRYGGDGATVLSTLTLNTYPLYLATDFGGHDWLDSSGGDVTMYKGATTDPTQVTTHYVVSAPNGLKQMALAPDRTLYVVNGAIGNQVIDAIPIGATTPSRTIGPFTSNMVCALAVDSQGQLYVALCSTGNNAPALVRVYDSAANGKPVPQRIITVQPTTTYIRGIAIDETPASAR
ncbi:MAG: hypothetical protein JO103_08905 [Candidatus Eremiobacteraeota bacterium]|nr:hypothetical protein [Candidatus Eremiobacteraeota bacterium]MBV9408251.1 hypothetical protein [Candidatus Eremiobacteraeota bacterium]